MIPTQTLTEFPVFGDSSTKVKPDDSKYSAGFVNADVLPYEWMNYLHNKASSGVTDLNSGMASVEAELNAVVTAGGATPSAETNNQVITAINYLIANAKAEAILAAHPIGSLYWSSKSTDPSTLFGGTWTQIKDKFILALGDTYKTVNGTGGAASVTLQTANLPSHSHTFAPSGTVSSTFTGSSATTGNESAHESYSWTGSHHHGVLVFTGSQRQSVGYRYAPNTTSDATKNTYFALMGNAASNVADLADSTTTWSTSSGYTDSSGYAYYAGWPLLTAYTTSSAKREIIKSTSITVSGTCTGDHTHTVTAKGTVSSSFSGTEGTTGSTGSGTSFSILPPYVVKYCWERTA